MALGSLASFRSNAIAAASRFPRFVAASALLAGSAIWVPPAVAKEQIHGMPDECATIVDRTARLDCGTNYYNRRKAAADARGAAADARSAAADARGKAADERGEKADKADAILDPVLKCSEFLKKGIIAQDFSRDRIAEIAGGKVNNGNMCEVARALGYGRRAALEKPDVR